MKAVHISVLKLRAGTLLCYAHQPRAPGIIEQHRREHPWLTDDELPTGAFMWLGTRVVKTFSGSRREHLLLGPGPTLEWDTLGYVQVISKVK